MSVFPKIIVGALATTAAAWILHTPLGLGGNCAVDARTATAVDAAAAAGGAAVSGAVANGASAVAEGASAVAGAASSAAAALTPEQVGDCQANVSRAASVGTINFATGGAALAPSSDGLLDGVAKAISDCAGAKIEVAGHTDAQGDAAANQALSERRAQAVVAALVQRGAPRDRLTARGYGETRLLHSDGPENDPRNRRIEFTVSAGA